MYNIFKNYIRTDHLKVNDKLRAAKRKNGNLSLITLKDFITLSLSVQMSSNGIEELLLSANNFINRLTIRRASFVC